MKRILIKYILSLAVVLFSKRKYDKMASKLKGNEIKVNLGCGLHCLAEWINIDGSLSALLGSKKFSFINKLIYRLAGSSEFYLFPQFNDILRRKKIYFYDLSKGLPFNDNSLDIIYCSHFLEHLSKAKGKIFLNNCYLKLKKGSLIRIAIPDLDRAFVYYRANEIEKMLDLFFYTSEEWDFSAHKYAYNFKLLKKIMNEIGFKNIKKCEFQEGRCPDIKYLDLYPDYTLYIEAEK